MGTWGSTKAFYFLLLIVFSNVEEAEWELVLDKGSGEAFDEGKSNISKEGKAIREE